MKDLARRVGEVYHQVFHIYRRWWMYILPFAAVLLIPMEVLDSALVDKIEILPDSRFLEILLLTTLSGVLASTSLLGQVFMAGAIGLSLIHAEDGNPPRLRWLARHISYWRLIAVDLLYLLAILVGTIFLFVPGLLALVYFALVGPAVEIEDRGVRSAFARSFRLVRTDFWLVLCVLGIVQLGSFLIGESLEHLTHSLLGEGHLIEALAKGLASVVIEPLFAIAAVLLLMRLSGMKPPPVATPHGRPS